MERATDPGRVSLVSKDSTALVELRKKDLSCCFPVSRRGRVEFGMLFYREDLNPSSILSWYAHCALKSLAEIQAASPMALGVKIPTVALHMTELFDTTVEQLYSIFTVKDVSSSLS